MGIGIGENNIVQEYLEGVCSEIKRKKIHPEIKDELVTHMEEAYEYFLEQGMNEERAVEEAVKQMGEAAAVGKQLNKVHRQWPDWLLLMDTFLLSIIGLAVIYLMEFRGALFWEDLDFFRKSTGYTVLGVAILAGLTFMDYRRLRHFSRYIYGFGFALWGFVLLTGNTPAGFLWVWGRSVSFNVLGVTSILFVVALAGLLEEWDWKDGKRFVAGVGLLGAPVIVFFSYHSTVYIAIYMIAAAFIMKASGAKIKHCIATGALVAVPTAIFIAKSYRIRMQLLTFINPERDPNGMGWLNIQMHQLLGTVGLTGKGFDFAPNMFPSVHSEFVLVYITYTFGWIATIALFALIAGFIWRMIRGAFRIRDSYGRVMATGVIALLVARFVWNVFMVLGLLPIGGVVLPFISYGGSQFIVDMAIIGILSGIYRRRGKVGSPVSV